MTDAVLERLLFAHGGVQAGARHHPEPDWALAARELKRPGVTLMILWEEYRTVHPDGYAYSRYVAARVM
jgi:transposase